MNNCEGHNAFSDIPGFDASKGERIAKALRKLWEKIERLEQMRVSEQSESGSKQVRSTDEDLTITDVKYRLLVLQLQYARSILRKKLGNNFEGFHSKPSEEELAHTLARIDSQISTDDQLFESEDHSKNAAFTTSKIASSKPHYHLKLDDVPFILGASSSASHSVVANVQNIIAMMKSHNRALCGPKQNVSKSVVNSNPAGIDTQDVTKMANDLSRDLYKLALKQQKLVQSIDAQANDQSTSNAFKNLQKRDKTQRILDKKCSTDPHIRHSRHRSNSESKINHLERKNFSDQKESDCVKLGMQRKQSKLGVRSQPSNLSIMNRRKLLRSLQNFKSHLSEEDISWN